MKKYMILLTISFAMFMEAVDTTILNTAIPVIAKNMDINPIDLKLALISYLMSLAILIPISGWIADKFGIKKIFICALFIFTISSIWCGFTQNLLELTISRMLQGMGGALTLPVGRLLIVRTSARHELIAKTSFVVIIGALGMILGPLAGGFITTHFSWRWIFWVNAPIGLVTILCSYLLLPNIPTRKVPALDTVGFLLFGSGLAMLTLGLSMLSETGINLIQAIIIIAIGILLLVFYYQVSISKKHPIVKVELLVIRTFRISVIGNLFARIGFGGVPFILPLLLQIGLGFSPQLSGFLLAPIALGIVIIKPLTIYFLRYLGYKKLLTINTICLGFSLSTFAVIDHHSSLVFIGLLTFIYGFLVSLQYTGMNSLAYANINNEDDFGAATSIMSTIQQLAQSFGVAIAAVIINLFSYPMSIHHSLSIQSIHQTFIIMGLLTLLSVLIFTHLESDDGQELIKKPTDISQ